MHAAAAIIDAEPDVAALAPPGEAEELVRVAAMEAVEDPNPNAPALLLIMGLGTQMVAWPESFCRDLAGQGFRVGNAAVQVIGHGYATVHDGPFTFTDGEVQRAELFGRSLRGFIAPNELEHYDDAIARCARGESLRAIRQLITGKGRARTVEFTARALEFQGAPAVVVAGMLTQLVETSPAP